MLARRRRASTPYRFIRLKVIWSRKPALDSASAGQAMQAAPLLEIRDYVAAKQLNRVHYAIVSQVAHLHEAKDLVHSRLLVPF